MTKAILKDTIEVLNERIEVKDRQLGRLMQQVFDLKKERDDAKHVCQHVGSMLLEVYKEQI